MMRHFSTTKKIILIFIIVGLLSFLVPVLTTPLDINSALNATAIFYSIILGFYIASAMTNLTRLKSLVAIETGALISVYYQVKLSMPEKLDQVRSTIDAYLIKRFDYEIADYTEPTTEEYFKIFDVLKGDDPDHAGDEAAMNYIAEAQYYVEQARREISIVGAKIMTSSSWTLLIVLSTIIVATLFLMRDGSIISNIVIAMLSSSAIISLFILDDVDGNRFGEEEFAINAYQSVFTAIGCDPYYPRNYIKSGRHTPDAKRYRTGSSSSVKLIGAEEQRENLSE